MHWICSRHIKCIHRLVYLTNVWANSNSSLLFSNELSLWSTHAFLEPKCMYMYVCMYCICIGLFTCLFIYALIYSFIYLFILGLKLFRSICIEAVQKHKQNALYIEIEAQANLYLSFLFEPFTYKWVIGIHSFHIKSQFK